MEFTVAISGPFSLEYTLESGQLFRWAREGEDWVGVVSGSALKVRQEGDTLRCQSSSHTVDAAFVSSYFKLDEDLDHILASISKDVPITRAVDRFYGLRLVRQDQWECLASFVLATNANIPRIKKMITAVCAKYGDPFEFDGAEYRSFPTPEALAKATPQGLRACGLGYRGPFLRHVAASVVDGKVDFGGLSELSYEESRKLLLKEIFGEKLLLGVGPKVADCVLLYSCGKDEAFPIDVWIARVLADAYPKLITAALGKRLPSGERSRLSPGDYGRISDRVRKHFGEYAGYAQQYLFMAAREGP